MIHAIISNDPSTSFLFEVIKKLEKSGIACNIIEIHPNDESYQISKQSISELPKNSIIFFLGHGQTNQLYGGESASYPKQPIVSLREMNLFQNQYLLVLACNSSELLRSSFRSAGTIKAIGFGNLPTDMAEVEANRQFNGMSITQETVDAFKEAIVDIVTRAFLLCYKRDQYDFLRFKDYIALLINKKINAVVINDKNSALANLLFKMKTELSIF